MKRLSSATGISVKTLKKKVVVDPVEMVVEDLQAAPPVPVPKKKRDSGDDENDSDSDESMGFVEESDDEVTCCICGDYNAPGKSRKIVWVECEVCKRWSHRICTKPSLKSGISVKTLKKKVVVDPVEMVVEDLQAAPPVPVPKKKRDSGDDENDSDSDESMGFVEESDDEVTCCICGDYNAPGKSRKIVWVECEVCKRWSHRICTKPSLKSGKCVQCWNALYGLNPAPS
uniref:Zinc finger PHD-type domain-containing protein n=1 Tax=Magallana gigas TaxID=29159 RepID=K1RGS8_MAGGI